jgi:hypothetical protein
MRECKLLILSGLFLIAFVYACSLVGPPAESQDNLATWVAATLTALETSPAFPTLTPTHLLNTPTGPPPSASATPLPPLTSSPLNSLVLETILCWEGPGARYEVVSALKEGERVEIIGRTSVAGWWIVDNPIYHDPCWAQAEYLQLDPGFNPLTLPVYTPPPTPTFTPTETPTPTRTRRPTRTP